MCYRSLGVFFGFISFVLEVYLSSYKGPFPDFTLITGCPLSWRTDGGIFLKIGLVLPVRDIPVKVEYSTLRTCVL